MTGAIIVILAELAIIVALGIILYRKMEVSERQSEDLQALALDRERLKKYESDCQLDVDSMFRVIQEEGFFPTGDENGEIIFEIQETKVIAVECVKGFFAIRVVYAIDKESFRAGLCAANIVNHTFVAVKTCLIEETDTLLFSVESYCKSIESYREFFHASLHILFYALGRFREEMDKLAEQQDIETPAIPARNQSAMLS